MSKLTNAEKDKLDNTCGNLRVTKLGTHVKSLEDFVNEGILKTRANDVSNAINELWDMITNKDCESITIPPPGFFTLFGDDQTGKLYVYYNNADYPPQFRHVETPGELEGTLYLYIADPVGENHYELEVGHYIAVKHLDNYYTKEQVSSMFTVTVEKQTTAESGSFATYIVKQGGNQVGSKINIPKDYLVKSCSVKTCTTANVPVQGYEVGDKYIDWVINTRDGSASNEHLYLLVNEIVDPYKPDNSTITLSSGNVFSVKDGGITLVKLAPAVQNLINGKADANHAHGNITKEGKVGTTPNVPLITGSDGVVQAGSFGSGTNNFARGNHGHSDLASIAYVDNQIASVEGDVVIDLASKADVDHKHSVMDLNNYMPKSNAGGGTAGYIKVLNIKTNQSYLDDPITFEIYQRQGNKPIYCSLLFSGGSTTDPTVSKFESWGSDNEVYIYKASTNNWQVIVKKIDSYETLTVENINCNWGRWSSWATDSSSVFTHLDETITSLPASSLKASYRAFGGRKIISGEDLNDIKKQGFYFNDMGNEALNILNNPNGKAFFLLVEDWGTNAYSVKQTFTSYSPNETYTRIYINGNWGDWLKILDSSNYSNYANKITKTSQLTNDGDGTNVFVKNNDSRLTDSRNPKMNHIGSSSSAIKYLNDYTTAGFYYCKHDVNEAPYVENQPLTTNRASFFLLVETWGDMVDYIKQTLTYYHNGYTYIRTKKGNTSGWTNWYKLSIDGHNHDSSYVKLSGGQTMTGNILIPSDADSTDYNATGHIPFAHTIQDTTKTVREILPTKKSFIGGIVGKKLDGSSGNQYDYVISIRHRNGGGDGYKYGMYIRAPWSTNGNLLWAESNGGDYGTEKTILDSGNYSQYANKTTIINDLTTGGTANALSAEQGKALNDNKADKTSVVNMKFLVGNGLGSGTVGVPEAMTHSKNGYLYIGCSDENGNALSGTVLIDFNKSASLYKRTLSNGVVSLQLTNTGTYWIKAWYHKDGEFKASIIGITTVS